MGREGQTELSVSVDFDGLNHVVTLRGELDLAGAPELERVLKELAPEADGYVLLDLERLSFTDAAGLAAIESVARALGNRLIVCGPRRNVRKVIELAHLDERVPVEDQGRANVSDVPGGNIAYVGLLWQAFEKGGAEEVVKIAPRDVRWRLLGAERDLTTAELVGYWRSRSAVSLIPTLMTAIGDDVLVTWTVRDGTSCTIWSLFRFHDRQLVETVSFDREAEAIAALRLFDRR